MSFSVLVFNKPPGLIVRLLLVLLVLLVLLSLGMPAGASALEAVEVSPDLRSLALGPHFEYLQDPERQFSLEEVRSGSHTFRTNSVEVFNPGYTFSGYWVRFRLRNSTFDALPLFLEFRSRFADHLNLYVPLASGDYQQIASGRMVPPSQRPYEAREFVFPLQLEPYSDGTYYLYVDSADTLTIPLYLHNSEGLNRVHLVSHKWLMFYQGLIFAMAVFSLFLLITLRDQVYVHYICAILLHHVLFFILFDGLGYAYFGLENPWWTREALSFILLISMLSIMQFSRILLDSQAQQPRLDRVVVWLQLVAGLAAVASLFVDYSVSIRLANPIASLTGALMWVIGWVSYWKGNSAARYYLAAWTFVIIGGLAYSLKSWGFAPSNLFTEYGWQIGSGIEAMLLSMAIAERINIEVRQRARLQQEAQEAQRQALEVQRRANETLEQSVRERTEALELANRRLQELSETDQLTGIKNRRYLDRYLERTFLHAGMEGLSTAILLLDVDHFKSLNDAHGHPAGDECLRVVAERLAVNSRNPTDLVARYGGEEFCLVLPGASVEAAYLVAERIRDSIQAAPVITRSGPLSLTVSIGVYAAVPQGVQDYTTFLEQADQALYRAKQQGRNQVVVVGSQGALDNQALRALG